MLNIQDTILYIQDSILNIQDKKYLQPCPLRGSVLDNSYLQFKFQLPTSDSTQITAGGPKVPIEGFVLLDAPSGKKYMCT